MKPLTIAVDVRMAESAGIGTYIRNVVPRVATLRPEWRWVLLGRPEEIATWASRTTTPIETRFCDAPIYSVREQWQLRRSIPGDATLVWVPHYNVPLVHPGRLVTTIHDLFHLAMPELVGGWHKKAYARYMFRQVARASTTIICDSQFTAQQLQFFTKVPSERLHVVHLGVDDAWFAPASGSSAPSAKPYFLFVGNVKPHKNLGRLLDAFGLIQERVPHDLVIVGKKDGFITSDQAVLQRVNGFHGRVRFTGRLSDQELHAWYAHAEALVFPSLYEGFSLPPLEAMASSCPVIATTAGAVPEVCRDSVTYVDPLSPRDIANAMLEVIGNVRSRGVVAKARDHARSYSWDRCAVGTNRALAEAAS